MSAPGSDRGVVAATNGQAHAHTHAHTHAPLSVALTHGDANGVNGHAKAATMRGSTHANGKAATEGQAQTQTQTQTQAQGQAQAEKPRDSRCHPRWVSLRVFALALFVSHVVVFIFRLCWR